MGADKGGNPEVVRKSQREQFAQVDQVDKVLDLDGKWREGAFYSQVVYMWCMELTI